MRALKKSTQLGLMVAIVQVAVVASLWVINPYTRYQSHQDTSPIIDQLTTITQQLTHLEQMMQKAAAVDGQVTQHDVQQLTTLMAQLKASIANRPASAIVDPQLNHKLDAIQQVMTTLDSKIHPIRYLPVTSLPFNVISIDSVQQTNVASVNYHLKTIPLEKNDTLAGWRVIRIDFGRQQLALENHANEQVIVNLNGVSHHD